MLCTFDPISMMNGLQKTISASVKTTSVVDICCVTVLLFFLSFDQTGSW